uniref:SWAP70 N-terminal EF-hand domain-containing protein n=1 Tax=Periophthalmus magnuspinnatus TaxID=409849 RepID=A0A3B3ZCK1_9GOBI
MIGSLEELLKCIWHAFTALDVDHRGKVSKSQLKVLSVNLCEVMKISFDPRGLENHFKGDESGPLSNQGYMHYLSNYILNKVQDNFNILELFKFCWTLCYKKNICVRDLHISHDNAFKVWCIFNMLSESKYPLYIVAQEIEYLLKMLTSAMGDIWSGRDFAGYDLKMDLPDTKSLTVWKLIELVGMHFFKNKSAQTLSTAINEVFEELILGILKQVSHATFQI